MKKFFLFIGFLFSISVYSFAGDSDNIVHALKEGNAAQFSNYFDNFVDLKLPEKDEIKNVGKTQASLTIKSFFDQAKIKGFDISSHREMGGTMYITGKLEGDIKDYNITMLMKAKGDKLSIITIRIS